MPAATDNPSPMSSHRSSGWQSVWRFMLWFLLAAVIGIGVAWLSMTLQSAGVAPLVLSSLLVGAGCGGLFVLLSRWTCCGNKRAMFIASFFLGFLLASMQHVFAYQSYHSAFQDSIENNPKAALAKTLSPEVGPSGFLAYMQAESRKSGYLWMWSIDALIIMLSTASVVWLGNRTPYCNGCHRWYKLTREFGIPGRLFSSVQKITGTEIPSDATMTKYRWYHCLRGCESAKVTLSWVTAAGKADEQSVWLDAAHRIVWDDAFQASLSETQTR